MVGVKTPLSCNSSKFYPCVVVFTFAARQKIQLLEIDGNFLLQKLNDYLLTAVCSLKGESCRCCFCHHYYYYSIIYSFSSATVMIATDSAKKPTAVLPSQQQQREMFYHRFFSSLLRHDCVSGGSKTISLMLAAFPPVTHVVVVVVSISFSNSPSPTIACLSW